MTKGDNNIPTGERVRLLRRRRAMTQEDLMERSGLSLATIQRAERGQRLAADTIASLAAAFDVDPTDLTEQPDRDELPYLPLKVIQSGRELLMLIAGGSQLDFGFVEITDLQQAELVERLQIWCQPVGADRVPGSAVAQVKLELEGTQLLRALAAGNLTVSGATFDVHAYDVLDDGDGPSMVMGEWNYTCVALRVGTTREPIDRAYVMDQLGKYEMPTNGVVFPPTPPISSEDILSAFGLSVNIVED
jgi:transcriptional regulator with XRE-family HTH domain